MTILTYQVFAKIVEQGSFIKAAQVLNLTPSAVSHTVSAMEKELGFAVFARSKRGVSLTNYGKQLLPFVNAVLSSEESLKQAVSEINGLWQGTVKVGCFSSVCTNWMPDIIRKFSVDYPAIEVEVFQGTYADVSDWIKNGVVDFGFLSTSSVGDLPIVPLYEDPLLCVTAPDYVRTEETPYMTIGEMQDADFVSQMETTDADISNFFKDNGLNVRTRYHVVDDLSTVALVSKGFGICIMPELVMRDIPYPVQTWPVEPKACRVIGVSALNEKLMAPAGRHLYQQVIETYQKN